MLASPRNYLPLLFRTGGTGELGVNLPLLFNTGGTGELGVSLVLLFNTGGRGAPGVAKLTKGVATTEAITSERRVALIILFYVSKGRLVIPMSYSTPGSARPLQLMCYFIRNYCLVTWVTRGCTQRGRPIFLAFSLSRCRSKQTFTARSILKSDMLTR